MAANWAALPGRSDPADHTPGEEFTDRQAEASADVFYVHPTLYFKQTDRSRGWNADVRDAELNGEVDEQAILNQASIFNGAGRVFAPRYRQANIRVYYRGGEAVRQRALDTAYADVLAAFDHYLTHHNSGRPIVIASHSQGTTHCKRLLADRFDGKPLGRRLVAAYLVGIPVSEHRYRSIPVCESPDETGCFVTWRTYRYDFKPRKRYLDTIPDIAVVNPLSWTRDTARVPATRHRGSVLYNYDAGPKPELIWAEIRGAGLFVSKPKFFGSFLFTRKNYHIGDYNLFWADVRENARARVAAFARGTVVAE